MHAWSSLQACTPGEYSIGVNDYLNLHPGLIVTGSSLVQHELASHRHLPPLMNIENDKKIKILK